MKIDINITHNLTTHCKELCIYCVTRDCNEKLDKILKMGNEQKPFFSEKKAKECVNIIEQNPMESNEDKWKKIKDIVDDTAHEVEVSDIVYYAKDHHTLGRKHIPFENIDQLPYSGNFVTKDNHNAENAEFLKIDDIGEGKKICNGNPKECEGCKSYQEYEKKHTEYHEKLGDECDYKCEYPL
jgi:hypothetical protein